MRLESKMATTLDWIRPAEGHLPRMAFRICPDPRSADLGYRRAIADRKPNFALLGQVTLVVVRVGDGFG